MRIKVTRLAEDGCFRLQVDDSVPGEVRDVPVGGTFEVEGTPAGALLGPGGFRTAHGAVYEALAPVYGGARAKYPAEAMEPGIQRDLMERFQDANAGSYRG